MNSKFFLVSAVLFALIALSQSAAVHDRRPTISAPVPTTQPVKLDAPTTEVLTTPRTYDVKENAEEVAKQTKEKTQHLHEEVHGNVQHAQARAHESFDRLRDEKKAETTETTTQLPSTTSIDLKNVDGGEVLTPGFIKTRSVVFTNRRGSKKEVVERLREQALKMLEEESRKDADYLRSLIKRKTAKLP